MSSFLGASFVTGRNVHSALSLASFSASNLFFLSSALAPCSVYALILGCFGTVCLCATSFLTASSRNTFALRALASSSICLARCLSSRCLPRPGTTSATDLLFADFGFDFLTPALGWKVQDSSSLNSFSLRASCRQISFSRLYSRILATIPPSSE